MGKKVYDILKSIRARLLNIYIYIQACIKYIDICTLSISICKVHISGTGLYILFNHVYINMCVYLNTYIFYICVYIYNS